MHIKNCNKNSKFISIEMERNELYFIHDCLQLGLQNLPISKEDRTKLISFLVELKNELESSKM